MGRLAADLYPALSTFDTVRDRHSLVIKRFGDELTLETLAKRVRSELRGIEPFQLRCSEIDVFEQPPTGPAPVVYLAVDSPALFALHASLVDAFSAVAIFEGSEYVPHITLARGNGDPRVLESLLERDIDPISWTTNELTLYDATYDEVTERIALG